MKASESALAARDAGRSLLQENAELLAERDALRAQLDFATTEYHREKEERRALQRELEALRVERNLRAERDKLKAALAAIATRGPGDGYKSASALLLRLVGTQSIARDALKD